MYLEHDSHSDTVIQGLTIKYLFSTCSSVPSALFFFFFLIYNSSRLRMNGEPETQKHADGSSGSLTKSTRSSANQWKHLRKSSRVKRATKRGEKSSLNTVKARHVSVTAYQERSMRCWQQRERKAAAFVLEGHS